jgi:hypothetical protein
MLRFRSLFQKDDYPSRSIAVPIGRAGFVPRKTLSLNISFVLFASTLDLHD